MVGVSIISFQCVFHLRPEYRAQSRPSGLGAKPILPLVRVCFPFTSIWQLGAFRSATLVYIALVRVLPAPTAFRLSVCVCPVVACPFFSTAAMIVVTLTRFVFPKIARHETASMMTPPIFSTYLKKNKYLRVVGTKSEFTNAFFRPLMCESQLAAVP